MSIKRIIAAYEDWRREGRTLVQATVYDTEGSTYSKTGHRILIADNGDYQGLISGGCLEGDLAEHAKRVIDSGHAETVTYDMRDEADELWGLGIGCNGLIRVLLQRLSPDEDYEPFETLTRHMMAAGDAVCATVIESAATMLPAGATFIDTGESCQYWRVPDEFKGVLRGQCARLTQSDAAALYKLDGDAGRITVLCSILRPLPRILVLGAGLDAQPLVEIAARIGWLVTVADHRPAYLQRGGFTDAQVTLNLKPEKLSENLNLSQFSAVIVMSHHLKTDRAYLRQLADSDIAYIGVLGPRARRERLLSELGTQGDLLRTRLRGPVGLDIGADSPESIALSILAEVQGVFAGRFTLPSGD
jgi:xanthine/CO dehydrogenase XdhC/CoxF family maturation factor